MPEQRRAFSIRTHILLIVLAGAIVPLALAGVWVTLSGARSGEQLLNDHLVASAAQFAGAIDERWQYRQADLLLLAENEVAGRLLSGGTLAAADSQYLLRLFASVQPAIRRVEYRDVGDSVRWTSADSAAQGPDERGRNRSAQRAAGSPSVVVPRPPVVVVRLPVPGVAGAGAGQMVAQVELAAMIPPDSMRPLVPGSHVAVRDSSGNTLIPLGVGEQFPREGTLSIEGRRWLAVHRSTSSPLEIVVAAPIAAYVSPFERAARTGVTVLVLVTLLALLFTGYLATRLSGSLQTLVNAADGVARGELDQRVVPGGPTEIRRVGIAFNVMTESLRKTLAELSHRTALAAVGEFATSLSHEVRNTLTSIRVDLQRAAKKPLGDATGRDLVLRALGNIAHLDSSVSGALRVARSAHAALAPVDTRTVLESAASVVSGTFAALPATLSLEGATADPIKVRGDAMALEQMFTNLLFNAAQALRPGGRAVITTTLDGRHVVVAIADNGSGMDEQQLERARQPFFSSKPYGTGVGLAIARQICAAHDGELTICSEVGTGTTVSVRIPVLGALAVDSEAAG